MATDTAVAATSENALISELQSRLKVPRSSQVPKAEHVALALHLAREPATDKTKGFWPTDIKSSDTCTRIKKLAKRMVAAFSRRPSKSSIQVGDVRSMSRRAWRLAFVSGLGCTVDPHGRRYPNGLCNLLSWDNSVRAWTREVFDIELSDIEHCPPAVGA